jgi:hypothetical protein
MNIDPVTGALAWLPKSAQRGPQNVLIAVTNSGGVAYQEFVVEVACPEKESLAIACTCNHSDASGHALLLLALEVLRRLRAGRRATAPGDGR